MALDAIEPATHITVWPRIVSEKEKYRLAQRASSTVGGANRRRELGFYISWIANHLKQWGPLCSLLCLVLLLKVTKNLTARQRERKGQASPKCLEGERKASADKSHRGPLNSSLDVSPHHS